MEGSIPWSYYPITSFLVDLRELPAFPGGNQPEVCTQCGSRTSQVNVLEELYELAQRTGAGVEFVDEDEFLQSIGGVGAILRY